MKAAAAARRWTCSGCGVIVRRIDGGAAPLPESWESCAEGELCLSCRRARAAEAAQTAVPSDAGRDIRAKARRAGLIEFEVRRTPELTDATIARACRTSTTTVAATRRRLRLDDGPPSGSNRNWAAARRATAGGT